LIEFRHPQALESLTMEVDSDSGKPPSNKKSTSEYLVNYMETNLKPRLVKPRLVRDGFTFSDYQFQQIFRSITSNEPFIESLIILRSQRNQLSAIKKVIESLLPKNDEVVSPNANLDLKNIERLELLEFEISNYEDLLKWHQKMMNFFQSHFVRNDVEDSWNEFKSISKVSSRTYKSAWNTFLKFTSEDISLVGRILSTALDLGRLDVSKETRRKLASGPSISSNSTTESSASEQHTVTIRILDLMGEEIVRRTWSSATSKVSVAISGPLRKFIESELNDQGRFIGSLEVSTSRFGIESTTLKKFENAASADVAKWAQNVL